MPQKRGKNKRELSRRNGLILNQTDENLLKDHPEYQTCLGLVKFGESGGEKTSLTEEFSLDEQLKDAEEEFLQRVALKELKLSETDDLIVENESESVGENDVEEIEPEKTDEEKNQKQMFFFQKSKRALEPRTYFFAK